MSENEDNTEGGETTAGAMAATGAEFLAPEHGASAGAHVVHTPLREGGGTVEERGSHDADSTSNSSARKESVAEHVSMGAAAPFPPPAGGGHASSRGGVVISPLSGEESGGQGSTFTRESSRKH